MVIALNNRQVQIIDRSVPELYGAAPKPSPHQLQEYIRCLRQSGVDLLEITSGVLRYLGGQLPTQDALLRIESREDIELCTRLKFAGCVIALNDCCRQFVQQIRQQNTLPIFLEIAVREPESLFSLDEQDIKNIDIIRIAGLDRSMAPEWLEYIQYIRLKYGVQVDICPGNRYHLATAAAYEAVLSPEGADYVSVAFAGLGGVSGYAALEEVMMALRVINNLARQARTEVFVRMNQIFKASSLRVPAKKPITGENIFRVESGIHADGITKNPLLYEPFDPGLVGQRRELTIGKHSGSAQLAAKLRELGLSGRENNLVKMLEKIRTRSIQLRRNLEDEELVRMCGE